MFWGVRFRASPISRVRAAENSLIKRGYFTKLKQVHIILQPDDVKSVGRNGVLKSLESLPTLEA